MKNVFVGILFVLLLSVLGFAAEQEVFADAKLQVDAGITPDSALYPVDEFFDRFSDELDVREEKIAEMRAMVDAGKVEEAKRALGKYKEFAGRVEENVAPDEKERAQRSAAAIRNTVRNFEGKVGENRKEFVDDVVAQEGKIETAAQIAVTVKQLCRSYPN